MKSNTSLAILFVVVALLILIGIIWVIVAMYHQPVAPATTTTTTTTTTQTPTTSDGTVTFATPPDFSLATNQQQITVTSYIPPCGPGNFNYCLYYTGTAYQGTNFESAGLSIDKRTDLTTDTTCLNTAPANFDASMKPNNQITESDYSASVFSNVGDAAAGHFAAGALYRLFIPASSSCYEFETRVGQTDFNNYPTGAIQQFTTAEQNQITAQLQQLLESIKIPSGESNLFAQLQ